MRIKAWGIPAACALLLAGPANTAKPDQRDFTFILMSDIHIGAENPEVDPPVSALETPARLRSDLKALEGAIGGPYPNRPEWKDLGKARAPRGIIILGDLTDGHPETARQEEQWKTYEGLYPAAGLRFGGRRVPVFDIAGNHDGEPGGPQRRGLAKRHRAHLKGKRVAAVSDNGDHFALNWDGVHLVALSLCAADTTDAETPFRFGKAGPGSWNDPRGALSFLKGYLERRVGESGAPVIVMQHYGFDGFSTNDWYWWTAKQRRDLHNLLKDYNVVAILHGHDHRARHYTWPHPEEHAADLAAWYGGPPPDGLRRYDVLSCGPVGWVIRIRGEKLIAAHFIGDGWSTDPASAFIKSLVPSTTRETQ